MKITSAAVGTGWPAAVDMIDTTGWESGYYTIDFILAADKYRDLNVASLVNHVDVLVETCAMAGACRLKARVAHWLRNKFRCPSQQNVSRK